MSEDKIKIPEDFPGKSSEQDPEIAAEVKKNKIWHLKLERYKEIASAIGFFLQTFKAEAVSLMSGLGTLVVGWFQLRKWVIQGRHDVKAESQGLSTKTMSNSGQGFGSGSGRLGAGHRRTERVESKVARKPAAEIQGPSQEVIAMTAVPQQLPTVFADPMNYVTLFTLIVFSWSSWKAWVKRKNKLAEKGGK